MAFGAILGQRPGVQSVNNVLPDVQGNVTLNADNVGAAPAGYGLGEDSSKSVGNWNAANSNGFYYSDIGGPDAGGYYGVVVNGQYSVNNYTQLVCNSRNGAMAVRHYRSNAYTPWEYITPPMVAGVEYRTTERYKGKAVYTQLVNFGALPNSSRKDVYFNAEGSIETIVDIHLDAYLSTAQTNYSGYLAEISNFYASSDKRITIITNRDASDLTAYVTVKYTKK